MVGGGGRRGGGGRARFQALISDLLRGQEENTEDGGVGEGLEKRDQVLSPPPPFSSLPLAPGCWAAEFTASGATD